MNSASQVETKNQNVSTDKKIEILEGYIERMSVYNENFYVLNIFTNNEEHKRIVGVSQIELMEHEYYEFTVEEKMHPKYGRGLHLLNVEKKQPIDKKNIIKILHSTIKGVGKKSAEKIYNELGEQTLIDLTKDPKIIYSIKGISSKIKDSIFNHFNEMSEQNEYLIKLQEMGLSYNEAYEFLAKIQTQISEDEDGNTLNPVEIIEKNPYIIRYELKRVGFLKCDFIARKIGFPKSHPIRIEECIYHILMEEEQSGDVCVEKDRLLLKLQIYLGLPIVQIESIIQDIEMQKEVQFEYFNGDIYLKKNSFMEEAITNKLQEIHKTSGKISNLSDNIEEDIEELEEIERNNNPQFKSLHPKQKEAIEVGFTSNMALLSGGPGTGKTTILRFIIELCKKYKLSYILCAPTGMASKKMAISTGEEAKTMHRTLEVDMSTGQQEFLRNENNPFDADMIIIDECSMIDMTLFYNFLKAVPNESKFLLIGDPDQLPSVGAGKIFDDLIQAEVFPHVHLSKIYRQGKNSMIVENAHRINNQEPMLLQHNDDFINDFYFINMKDVKQVAKYIKELASFRLNSKGYDSFNDIQVLLPRKKGELGVLEYNFELQAALNPPSESKKEVVFRNRWIFREGDKVMQLANNQDKDIFNGDVGFITKIYDDNTVEVDFSLSYMEEKVVEYSYEDLEELILAYSCTVHKSQGSEYKVVIMPIIEDDYMMLYKKLVYTAITRGRELVILVGDYSVLANNLYIRTEKERNSNLAFRLKTLYNEIDA